MSLFRQRKRPFLFFATGLVVSVSGCGEDLFGDDGAPALATSTDCSPACSGATRCFLSEGTPTCLIPTPGCEPDRCAAGASCVSGSCEFETASCDPSCGSGSHCVSGHCIPNYSSGNACDPLASCRSACGTDATCLAACDDDRSGTCSTCLGSLQSCESREDCDSNPFDCCQDSFCDCFPSDSGCGNVLPCSACANECGDDASCFEDCMGDTPACSSCLGPFFDCRETASDPAAECEDEFLDCAPAT